ncbi:TPA: hypothetical protein OUD88_002873 [Enterobacter hormaechei]|nr:hypothetical protein [Enterobacter hormaechei]
MEMIVNQLELDFMRTLHNLMTNAKSVGEAFHAYEALDKFLDQIHDREYLECPEVSKEEIEEHIFDGE